MPVVNTGCVVVPTCSGSGSGSSFLISRDDVVISNSDEQTLILSQITKARRDFSCKFFLDVVKTELQLQPELDVDAEPLRIS